MAVRKIRWLKKAEAALTAYLGYVAEYGGAAISEKNHTCILESLGILQRMPWAGPEVPGKRYRKKHVPGLSITCFYAVRARDLVILGFRHDKQPSAD